jgi:hypothetical protein
MPEETAAKQHGDEATKSIILLNNKPCYVRFAKITKTTPRGSYTPRHTRIYAAVHSSESRPFPFILSPWEIIALIDRDAIFPLDAGLISFIAAIIAVIIITWIVCVSGLIRASSFAGNQWSDAIIGGKWINSRYFHTANVHREYISCMSLSIFRQTERAYSLRDVSGERF